MPRNGAVFAAFLSIYRARHIYKFCPRRNSFLLRIRFGKGRLALPFYLCTTYKTPWRLKYMKFFPKKGLLSGHCSKGRTTRPNLVLNRENNNLTRINIEANGSESQFFTQYVATTVSTEYFYVSFAKTMFWVEIIDSSSSGVDKIAIHLTMPSNIFMSLQMKPHLPS